MIWVGIDDTDMPDTPGTNQLARKLVQAIAVRFRCRRIVRHQLCGDPSIPCTSKNGSASIWLEPVNDPGDSLAEGDLDWLRAELIRVMREWYVVGSDPGLCIATSIPDCIVEFGLRAQQEIVTQSAARDLAKQQGLSLEGLGGTEGGVIGALAAVGLARDQNDGRIVQYESWPDDLEGIVTVNQLASRAVQVRDLTGQTILAGRINLGKKLRPNCRAGLAVLTVEPGDHPAYDWRALKVL